MKSGAAVLIAAFLPKQSFEARFAESFVGFENTRNRRFCFARLRKQPRLLFLYIPEGL